MSTIEGVDQLPIDSATEPNRVLDFIIEFGIHNKMTATIGEALNQFPRNELCQLRRCTLKGLIIFYVETIISRNNKNHLEHGLKCLQSLTFNNNKAMKAYLSLERGIKYQIIMHHLEECGLQSAKTMIDTHFPLKKDKDNDNDDIMYNEDDYEWRTRQSLLKICRQFDNDEEYDAISWNNFKDWTINPFQRLIKDCGEPVIAQVAKARIMTKQRRS